jgi:hypothetical protein
MMAPKNITIDFSVNVKPMKGFLFGLGCFLLKAAMRCFEHCISETIKSVRVEMKLPLDRLPHSRGISGSGILPI